MSGFAAQPVEADDARDFATAAALRKSESARRNAGMGGSNGSNGDDNGDGPDVEITGAQRMLAACSGSLLTSLLGMSLGEAQS
jgi:hypothetical protein